MKVKVFRSLTDQPESEIRWPGSTALKTADKDQSFAAMLLLVDEDAVRAIHEAYSLSLAGREGDEQIDVDMRAFEVEGPGRSGRFLIARLVIREWARALHGDRINIVLGDEPRLKNRIRSHKGLVPGHCKASVLKFEQLEVETNSRSSALLNRIEIDSSTDPSCLVLLGDTFRSFGMFDWPDQPGGDLHFSHLASAYANANGVWRWDAALVLSTAFASSSSFFFLQGVANETLLQLVVYIPVEQLGAHLKVLTKRFQPDVVIQPPA